LDAEAYNAGRGCVADKIIQGAAMREGLGKQVYTGRGPRAVVPIKNKGQCLKIPNPSKISGNYYLQGAIKMILIYISVCTINFGQGGANREWADQQRSVTKW
jgi:hypothetical protein